MAPFFRKLAVFSFLLVVFCINATAAEGGRWVFSSISGGITGGRAAFVVWGNGQFVAVGRWGTWF